MVENFNSFQLNHGLMEVGYVDHYAALPNILASGLLDQTLSVSMTATMGAMGNIVLGKIYIRDLFLFFLFLEKT